MLAHAYGTPDESWPETHGRMMFSPKTIESMLEKFGLHPHHTPLSVLAIEFLPLGGTGFDRRLFGFEELTQNPQSREADPAGAEFPGTRILRTSTLTPVTAQC